MRILALMAVVLAMTALNSDSLAQDKFESVPAFPVLEIADGAAWPGFYLPDLDGKPLSVQDYRGKKIVLHIFASW